MDVHWTYVNPGQINTAHIRGQIQAASLQAQARMLKYLQAYVSTWDHQPDFKRMNGYKGGDIWAGITTDDDVFWYLEMGTHVRHAIMTDDFEPKTAPRQIQSKSGAGGVAKIDRNFQGAGIERRAILEEIVNIETPRWEKNMSQIFASIHFIGGGESHLG